MGQNQSKEYQNMMKKRTIDALKKAMPAKPKPTTTSGKGAAFAKRQTAKMLVSYRVR